MRSAWASTSIPGWTASLPCAGAIADKLQTWNRMTVDPETQVLVTSGATAALYSALLALLNPGDEVIVFEPFYGYHVSTLLSLRMKPVIVPLAAPDWQLDAGALQEAITPRTRAILINTPAKTLRARCSRARSLRQLRPLRSSAIFLSLPTRSMSSSCTTALSISRWRRCPEWPNAPLRSRACRRPSAITGWRIGYLTASPRWIPAIGYFHDLTYICAPAPLQAWRGGGAAAAGAWGFLSRACHRSPAEARPTVLGAGRRGVCHRRFLRALITFWPIRREFRVRLQRKRARELLRATGVAAVSGSAFFRAGGGENLLRFCFGKQAADLDRACAQLLTL